MLQRVLLQSKQKQKQLENMYKKQNKKQVDETKIDWKYIMEIYCSIYYSTKQYFA